MKIKHDLFLMIMIVHGVHAKKSPAKISRLAADEHVTILLRKKSAQAKPIPNNKFNRIYGRYQWLAPAGGLFQCSPREEILLPGLSHRKAQTSNVGPRSFSRFRPCSTMQ